MSWDGGRIGDKGRDRAGAYTVGKYGSVFTITLEPVPWWKPRGVWARLRNPHYVRDFQRVRDAPAPFLALDYGGEWRWWAIRRERELRRLAMRAAEMAEPVVPMDVTRVWNTIQVRNADGSPLSPEEAREWRGVIRGMELDAWSEHFYGAAARSAGMGV